MSTAGFDSNKSTLFVTLNIEGTVFKTLKSTCQSIDGSLLQSLTVKSEHYDDTTGMYYFDRDVRMFSHILAAHREAEIHVPRDVCPIRFRKEMAFWKIPHKLLGPCCWKYYYECDDDVATLKDVVQSLPRKAAHGAVDVISGTLIGFPNAPESDNISTEKKPRNDTKSTESLQNRLWLFLDEPQSSTAAKVWCFTYLFFVIVSVVLNIIWLDTGVRVDPYNHKYIDQFSELELYELYLSNETFNFKIKKLILTDPHKALFIIDSFCIVFFIVETIVHFTVCPDKLKYCLSLYNGLKVVLSFCMVIGVVFEVRKDWISSEKIGIMWFSFKSMNTLRLLLMLRLHKVYTSLHLVYVSIRRSLTELFLLLMLFVFTLVVYGGLIFSMEIESEMFPDTRKAMWWALITMTTIGYGDFYPTDTWGYLVGFLCAINGLIVIALPIAGISSNFACVYSRHSEFEKHVEAIKVEEDRNVSIETSITPLDGNGNK